MRTACQRLGVRGTARRRGSRPRGRPSPRAPWRSDSASRAWTSLTNLSAARGGIRSGFLTWAGDWPCDSASATATASRSRRTMSVDQAGHPLTLLPQLEQHARAQVLRSPATSASASVQTLRSDEVAHDSSTSSAPMLAPAPCSSASFSSSRSEPLLAVADLGDQRLRALAVEIELQLPGLPDQPLRQVPRLDVASRPRSDRRPSRRPRTSFAGVL